MRAISLFLLFGFLCYIHSQELEFAEDFGLCDEAKLEEFQYLFPNLQAVVPIFKDTVSANKDKLNSQTVSGFTTSNDKSEYIRVTTAIANSGPGNLEIRPDFYRSTAPTSFSEDDIIPTFQYLVIPDFQNKVSTAVCYTPASVFYYHPSHNHFHAGNTTLFEILPAFDDETGEELPPPTMECGVNGRRRPSFKPTLKVGTCYVDSQTIADGPDRSVDRYYWDCYYAAQGIQATWMDQYHHSLDGQELDVTGIAPGTYYIHVVVNPYCGGKDYYTCETLPEDSVTKGYLETTCEDNSAWTKIIVDRKDDNNTKNGQEQGNISVTVIGHSDCPEDDPLLSGLCGSNKNW